MSRWRVFRAWGIWTLHMLMPMRWVRWHTQYLDEQTLIDLIGRGTP